MREYIAIYTINVYTSRYDRDREREKRDSKEEGRENQIVLQIMDVKKKKRKSIKEG